MLKGNCGTSLFSSQTSSLECIALLIAGLARNLCHPGLDNDELITSDSLLADRYNDVSIVENLSCYSLFRILRDIRFNFLSNLSKEEFAWVRKIIIHSIMAMDINGYIPPLKHINDTNNDVSKEDKLVLYSSIARLCDNDFVYKKWEIRSAWSKKYCEELRLRNEKECESNVEKRLSKFFPIGTSILSDLSRFFPVPSELLREANT